MVSILLAASQAVVTLVAGDIVSANFRGTVVSVHSSTGEFKGVLADSGTAEMRAPTGVAFDAMSRLHVASSRTASVLRFHPDGRFDRVVVSDTALGTPFSLAFDRQGVLYVSSGNRHRVARYDPESGRFMGVAARATELKTPIGLGFTPDGTLLVANGGGNSVLEFDPVTGEYLRTVASDSLEFPSDVLVEGDGTLLVTSAISGAVHRFDLATGRHLGRAATLPPGGVPVGIARGCDGRLVIGDFGKDRLYRLTRSTLEQLTDHGLQGPENIAVVPCGAGP